MFSPSDVHSIHEQTCDNTCASLEMYRSFNYSRASVSVYELSSPGPPNGSADLIDMTMKTHDAW